MPAKLMTALLTLALTVTATRTQAQDVDNTPGNRNLKIQRDHLTEQFGVSHRIVVKLNAQIRREANARMNPEISLVHGNIDDLDMKSFRHLVVTLMSRIAILEKEVAKLKSRVSEFESDAESPAPQ